MKTAYEQIVDVNQIGKNATGDLNSFAGLAQNERFQAAVNDSVRRLVLCIDVQNDFIEGGALAVPGSIGDVERITRFIYRNMAGITKIMCSSDTHYPQQIFFPCWWKNANGDNPNPYDIITYDDVVAGRWRAVVSDVKKSNEYLKALQENSDKKNLCIWPYHCINGLPGHAFENQFAKMVYFHSMVRKTKPIVISKGSGAYSEMYGILKPEFAANNESDGRVISAIIEYDEIYVVGEAASHCLLESVKQIAEFFAKSPEITQKITILEDCTSPIPGYEAETATAFANFKSTYGIKFAKSTDIQF